jgi:hypothetical protein
MSRTRRFPGEFCLAFAVAPLLSISAMAQDETAEALTLPETGPVEISVDSDGDENLLMQHQQDMTNRFFAMVGGPLMAKLIDSGLSLADSEEITRKYAAEFTACTTSAVTIEAERQGISVDELIANLREATFIGNVKPSDDPVSGAIQRVSEVMDVVGIEANLVPCVIGAMQNAGISFQSGVDALPEPAVIEVP